MIFGDRQSESPRVPSPWTNARRRASSPRTTTAVLSSSCKAGSPDFDGRIADARLIQSSARKENLLVASGYSPLSRAVQCGGGVNHSQVVAVHLSRQDIDEGNTDSLTSTPPTEEEDDDDDVVDGFFALDTDLDLLNLDRCASDKSLSSTPDLRIERDEQQQTRTLHGQATDDVVSERVDICVPRTARRPTQLAPEPDLAGNLEYKLRILPPTRHRYDKLLTQLQWRLLQGGGECTYEIGVLDDGLCIGICSLEMRASLRVLASMASELGGAIVRIRKAFSVVSSPDHVNDGKATTANAASELRAMSNADAHAALLADMDGSTATCSCGLSTQTMNDTVAYIPRSMLNDDQAKDSSTVSTRASLAERITIEISSSEGHDFGKDDHGTFLVQQPPDGDERNSGKGLSSEGGGNKVDVKASAASSGGGGGGESKTDIIHGPFYDDDDDDEEQDLTFSLSLDERATRSGFGFRRPRTEARRASRYSAKNAAASHRQRAKVAAAQQQASIAYSGSSAKVDHSSAGRQEASQSPLRRRSASGAAKSNDYDGDGDDDAAVLSSNGNATCTPSPPCVRLIVEATVLRARTGSEAYIDYSSL